MIAYGYRNQTTNFTITKIHQFNEAENKKKALELYIKSANQGYAKVQVALGHTYMPNMSNYSDIKKDENKGCILYEKAAKQGNAEGLLFLGGCYEDGTGVVADRQKAISLYE